MPPEVAAITDRALRIEPGERFQTADEMLAAVRELLPQGIEVHEDMLVALEATARGQVAPAYHRRAHTSSSGALRAAISPASPGPVTITPVADPREPVDSFAGTQVSPSGRPLANAATAPAAMNVATTGPGVVATTAPPMASSASKLPVIAIAIACCVAGGAGVYLFTRQAAPAPAPAAQPPPTAPTQAAPTPTPTATHTSTATAPTASATAPPAAPSASATASAEPTAPTPSPGEHPHAKPPHVHATSAAPTAAPLDLGPASFGGRK